MRAAFVDTSGQPLQPHQLPYGMGLAVVEVVVTAQPSLDNGLLEPVLLVQIDVQAPPRPLPWIPPEVYR